VSAKTKYYICGVCGFRNHPRHPLAGRPDIPTDDTKCEQCGTARDHDDSTDYTP
jgi:hypothetical protein